MSESSNSFMECPSCKAKIPFSKHEVSWCHHCDWNVDLVSEKKEEDIFQKFSNSVGRKISEGIYADVIDRKSIRPSWSKAKIATLAIGCFVIFVPILLFVLNLIGYFFLPRLFFYIFLALTSGYLYVSYSKWKKKPEHLVERAEFPVLYNLVDEISFKIGNYSVSGIALNSAFNAFYTEVEWGPFKKRYISLGLPLIEILTAEELIALISHEVSHGANGDIMRYSFMHRARYIIAETFYMFFPQHSREGTDSRDLTYLIVILSNYLFYGLAQIPFGFFKLMTKLYMRDSQEAEYYADLVATDACGKRAMINMLMKLRYFDEFDHAVGKLALEKDKYDFFLELKKLCSIKKSERAVERMYRLEKLKGLSLDSTHPPTGYRMQVIETMGREVATVSVEVDKFNKLAGEISVAKARVIAELLDARLKVLYGG